MTLNFVKTEVLVHRCRYCGSKKGEPHKPAVHLAVNGPDYYQQWYPTWEPPPTDFTTSNMTFTERRDKIAAEVLNAAFVKPSQQFNDIERYLAEHKDREFARYVDAVLGAVPEPKSETSPEHQFLMRRRLIQPGLDRWETIVVPPAKVAWRPFGQREAANVLGMVAAIILGGITFAMAMWRWAQS